LSKRK
jgi:V-type H+-transporting ATPase subunit a